MITLKVLSSLLSESTGVTLSIFGLHHIFGDNNKYEIRNVDAELLSILQDKFIKKLFPNIYDYQQISSLTIFTRIKVAR